MTGRERDRVETLLRERSAEMTRTPVASHLHLDYGAPFAERPVEPEPAPEPDPVVQVSHEDTCCGCGDRIAAARLKALPNAVRCVTCQRAFELGIG